MKKINTLPKTGIKKQATKNRRSATADRRANVTLLSGVNPDQGVRRGYA